MFASWKGLFLACTSTLEEPSGPEGRHQAPALKRRKRARRYILTKMGARARPASSNVGKLFFIIERVDIKEKRGGKLRM